MLARGYISDNGHFPDAEFQQSVEGMRRLKPACDQLATASEANHMASMQEIDEAVLQFVKDCGRKLANTVRTNNHVPPPGPGVPPAQVIVRPMLLPLNVPPQCQWCIATAVVPNAGPVGHNPPLTNAPGPAQNVPAPPACAQAVPAPPANALAQNIAAPRGPADPKAQNNHPPSGPANPPRRIGLSLRNLYGQKMGTNQRIFLGRSIRVPQWAFWVPHWVSNMLQLIPQVRSICPAKKIYLCKSKRIPQLAFWVRNRVSNMLQ